LLRRQIRRNDHLFDEFKIFYMRYFEVVCCLMGGEVVWQKSSGFILQLT